jgi:hypothetical protein
VAEAEECLPSKSKNVSSSPLPPNKKRRRRKFQVPVTLSYNASYPEVRDQEDCSLKPAPNKKFSGPYLENTQHKEGQEGMSQVGKCLPIKYEALNSTPVPLPSPQTRKRKSG